MFVVVLLGHAARDAAHHVTVPLDSAHLWCTQRCFAHAFSPVASEPNSRSARGTFPSSFSSECSTPFAPRRLTWRSPPRFPWARTTRARCWMGVTVLPLLREPRSVLGLEQLRAARLRGHHEPKRPENRAAQLARAEHAFGRVSHLRGA